MTKQLRDYDYWKDGLDFRSENTNFCQKCSYKGTFIKEVINEEKGTQSIVVIDCECKKEYVTKMRLREAGIHPQYYGLNASLELSSKIKDFVDKFYRFYKDEDKVAQNLLLTGSNKAQKTRLLALFAKRILYKSMNIRFKYITLADLLITINKIWKENQNYAVIEDFYQYDFLIIDKIETSVHQLKNNMSLVVLTSILENRDQNQKPTLISAGSTHDADILGIDLSRFIVKELD